MKLTNSFLNVNPLLVIGFVAYSSYYLALYSTDFLYRVGSIKMHEVTKNNLKE